MRKRRRKIKLEMGKLGLPDVFGKTVFDEFLVLELVEAHEDGEIAGFRARFEVEHHRVALLRFHAHEEEKKGSKTCPFLDTNQNCFRYPNRCVNQNHGTFPFTFY